MIDLHCHILPGIDDGPDLFEESLYMARKAFSDGVLSVAATPHNLNGVYINIFEKISGSVENLQKMFNAYRVNIKLFPGSEEYFRPGLAHRLMSGESSTLNNTGRYVLVEFPFESFPSEAKDEFFQLKLKGITPIVAHPERNTTIQNKIELVSELISAGAMMQITAMSITGELGEAAKSCSHLMLENRMAHIIASDAHSADFRTPVLSHAVDVAAGILKSRQEAIAMVSEAPDAVLKGLPVCIPEHRNVRKKKWWSFP